MNTQGTDEHSVTVALPPVRPQLYTCFIKGPEGIKIGRSYSPRHRRTELQPGCASELKVLLIIHAEHISEPAAHTKFKHLKIRGEWYRPELELLDFIEEMRSKIKPHPGNRIRKGPPALEAVITGLLKQRRGSSETRRNLIHNLVQQLRNHAAETDVIAKVGLERLIAYTTVKVQEAA